MYFLSRCATQPFVRDKRGGRKWIVAAALAWPMVMATAPGAIAATIVLDFEGLLDLELVQDFYAGGEGSQGSSYARDFGIRFSNNVITLTDLDAGGSAGDFGGEPSPDNIIFFREGDSATLSVDDGFRDGFSLFYSAVTAPASATIYDGLNGSGNILAQLLLPVTPAFGEPEPNSEFSPFVPLGVEFTGLARSVRLGGTARAVGFDNLTLGSAIPRTGSFDPTSPIIPPNVSPLLPQEPAPGPPNTIPEPSLMAAMGAILVWRYQRYFAASRR